MALWACGGDAPPDEPDEAQPSDPAPSAPSDKPGMPEPTVCGGEVAAVVAPELAIDSGPLRGMSDDDLVVFKGIPYAAPPVGALRFRTPQPVAAWSEPHDASQFGAACPQAVPFFSGDEDCLTANVWAHAGGGPRPVMVFIHGGGFFSGESASGWYDGARLARVGEVVVVSFNYRVHVLGGLATEALAAESGQDSAGNYGVRDQIAALQWVQQNIGAFGGDPCRVTIFGESAGGDSVCMMLTSPLAVGLFQQAIVQSGLCHDYPALRESSRFFHAAVERGADIAENVGCTAADELTCLRNKSADELVNAGQNGAIWLLEGAPETWPNIDGVVLVDQPGAALAAGIGDVPLMVGANADEAEMFTALTVIVFDFDYAFKLHQVLEPDLAEAVLALYPASAFGSPKDAYNAFVSDVAFVCPSERTAAAAASGKSPSFFYHFTHGLTGWPLSELGAFHALDLAFVFGNWDMLPVDYTPTPIDIALTADVQRAWTNFAQTGAPGDSWPAYQPGAESIYQIAPDPAVVGTFRGGRCDGLRALGLVQ